MVLAALATAATRGWLVAVVFAGSYSRLVALLFLMRSIHWLLYPGMFYSRVMVALVQCGTSLLVGAWLCLF